MFSYYGSKAKVVDLYPRPKYGRIIEPFAGSARYALKYWQRDVTLVDKYEVIVRIWKWLQQAAPEDILSIPDFEAGTVIDRSAFQPVEKAWLVGFIIQAAVSSPRLTVTPMGAKYLKTQKKNIARQLHKIRHWNILLGDYSAIPNQEATWFIDPPYQFGGEYYIESNRSLDYAALAAWCKSRHGQVIVCENTKATWMDFKPMRPMKGTIKTTTEAIWSNMPHNFQSVQMPLMPDLTTAEGKRAAIRELGFWQYE